MSEKLPSTVLVIFGVSGDLSRRYLLPALSEICQSSDIRTHLRIIGLSRRQIEKTQVLDTGSKDLADQFEILQIDYEDHGQYKDLKNKLEAIGAK